MLQMNLITQEELWREVCDEVYWGFNGELYGELDWEVSWALGFPILTDFRGYNTVCYK
jgi:hypothetical protein